MRLPYCPYKAIWGDTDFTHVFYGNLRGEISPEKTIVTHLRCVRELRVLLLYHQLNAHAALPTRLPPVMLAKHALTCWQSMRFGDYIMTPVQHITVFLNAFGMPLSMDKIRRVKTRLIERRGRFARARSMSIPPVAACFSPYRFPPLKGGTFALCFINMSVFFCQSVAYYRAKHPY